MTKEYKQRRVNTINSVLETRKPGIVLVTAGNPVSKRPTEFSPGGTRESERISLERYLLSIGVPAAQHEISDIVALDQLRNKVGLVLAPVCPCCITSGVYEDLLPTLRYFFGKDIESHIVVETDKNLEIAAAEDCIEYSGRNIILAPRSIFTVERNKEEERCKIYREIMNAGLREYLEIDKRKN